MSNNRYNNRWRDFIPTDASPEKQEFLHLCIDIVWGAYKQAGCPLGPSRRGFAMWSQNPTGTTVN